ncbi:MAG: prolyl oligopeptidase family serine peptidase [Chloroflexota bacterium]
MNLTKKSAQSFNYPDSLRGDVVENLHGVDIPDPYRWLEENGTDAVKTWIEAQNTLTLSYLDNIPAREEIQQRVTELWDYEKFGIPFKRGERYFYTYNDGLQNQNVLYWQETLDSQPKVLLDPNTLSPDGTIALTAYAISKDGNLLAYALSEAGSDWKTWYVREIDTGEDRPDKVAWAKFSGASWTSDHQGFFYSRYDEPSQDDTYKQANVFQKLYYHRLGTEQNDDILIYERPDQEKWGFYGHVTEDGTYLIIYVSKGTYRENAIFYVNLQNGLESTVTELLPRFDASYTFVGNDGALFYFTTDLDAPMSRLIAIDISIPQPDHWREIIPESQDNLQGVRYINQQFVAHYLHNAHSQVKLIDKTGQFLQSIDLPGIGTVGGFDGQQDDSETFFAFTSFTTPSTVYRYDLAQNKQTLFRGPQIDFDPDDYITEQVFYPSKDGTQIPMFLTYKKGTKRDGDTPTFLYGYGGFSIPLTPNFSIANLVWMERGGIYAQANLRGGGEFGKHWHEAGAKSNKQNVFDDFIAAAEWLIANNYTCTERLAIGGGSNGGLLVGACLTQRPDLFGACWAAVGVLDMLRFHKFTIGRAWTSDYGSPDDPDDFEILLKYSPYHNLKGGTRYPPTLITTGDHDDRVFPAHSFKFAAELQHAHRGENPCLIRIETDAGHGQGKPTTKLIISIAERWAFIIENLGME